MSYITDEVSNKITVFSIVSIEKLPILLLVRP